MLVLDTNVISELMRPEPDPHVLAWLDAQNTMALYTTAVNAAELRAGVAKLPPGKRRSILEQYVDGVLTEFFEHRVLPFEERATADYAHIVSTRGAMGHPISIQDALIAAIAKSYEATVVTRNTRDFIGLGLTLIDPWQATA